MTTWVKVCAVLSVLAFAFSGGYYVRALKAQRDLAQLNEQMQQELAIAQQRNLELTDQLSHAVNKADTESAKHESELNNTYEHLVDSLRDDAGRSAGESKTGGTVAAGAVYGKCDCRQYAASQRAFRKLQKDVLAITYKCDRDAARYNELRNLYLDLQKLLNQ